MHAVNPVHFSLQKDPAIERWAKMRETTHLHFKFTPKTVFIGVFWGLVVPGAFYYLLKWDLVIVLPLCFESLYLLFSVKRGRNVKVIRYLKKQCAHDVLS